MASERMTSSVTTPPALRSVCTSPSFSPNSANTSMRESMQVSSAVLSAGGTATPSALALARCPPPAS